MHNYPEVGSCYKRIAKDYSNFCTTATKILILEVHVGVLCLVKFYDFEKNVIGGSIFIKKIGNCVLLTQIEFRTTTRNNYGKQKKIYVIMEAGWEYDDQYYSRSSGGTPSLYYEKREQAETACAEMNKTRQNSEDARDYYDCEDISEIDFYEVVEVKIGD